jgi:hypothetical protein
VSLFSSQAKAGSDINAHHLNEVPMKFLIALFALAISFNAQSKTLDLSPKKAKASANAGEIALPDVSKVEAEKPSLIPGCSGTEGGACVKQETLHEHGRESTTFHSNTKKF